MTAESIAAVLRDAIERGDYAPGDQLPGENTLIEQYSAARLTVRHALGMLQAEGLTIAKHGIGVFVRTFNPIVRNSIARISATQWQGGKAIWDLDTEDRILTVTDVTITPQVRPTPEIAALLKIDEGTLIATRSRTYILDGKPVMTATSHFPAALVTGTPILNEDTGPGGVYARLAEIGHAPTHFREDVISRMPTKAETQRLALTAATPVFDVTRTAITDGGMPAEMNRMILDAASYVLRYDFQA